MRILRRPVFVVGIAVLLAAVFASASGADPPEVRIDAPTVEATDAAGADASYHVKSYDPATHEATVATCDIPAGTAGSGDFDAATQHYPLGSTTVTCTATVSGASNSASVVVQDTTPPAFASLSDVADTTTDPGGKNVSYSTPSASDAVSGSIPGTCTPASGSHFDVGSTQVTCTATDSSNNTGQATFDVVLTLIDNTPPTFTSVPADITREATGPGGATVNYTITATDNAGPPTISCGSHPSGSTFPITTTTVTCTATDASSNSTQAQFHVTVQDTTDPAFPSVPNVNENSSDPGGKNVSYPVPSASDAVSGSIVGSCTPASGSHFPIGSTTVTCNATDSHGNTGTVTFHVNVTLVDQTPPVLSNVPANIHVEANGPAGSVANFTKPTATDNIDGPIALVVCTPASGSTFPLGTTTVTCSATDSHGNTGTASFTVTVVDTTPPHLVPPADRSVYATSPAGIYPGDDAAAAFMYGYSVSDIADPHPTVTHNAPSFFLVGETTVTFVAHDASGNTASAQATLDVRPMPSPGTTPPPLPQPKDRTPPDDVTNLVATPGDATIALTWTKPTAKDFDHVIITRARTAPGALANTVYTGSASPFADRGVQNGIEYRYVVVAVDKAGNRSGGVVAVAVPKASALMSPKSGARIKKNAKSAKFRWRAVKGARYYNLQLFRGGERVLAAGTPVKVLSTWPTKPSFVLKRQWKYAGKRYKLAAGLYTWYVWPGLGPRSAAEYGPLLGASTFRVG
jgi:HYR domain